MQVIEVVQAHVRVRQTNSRKKRIVFAEESMCSDVNVSRARAVRSQALRSCLVRKMQFASRQNIRYCAGFVQDVGRAIVRNTKDERCARRVRNSFFTNRKDA